MSKRYFLIFAAGLLLTSISLATWLPPSVHSLSTADAAAEPKITPKNNDKANKAAIERTRKQVRMLDDLYKTAVVLITTHYVKDETSFPAGGAAVALFDAMRKKGWHDVRLLDAAGEPLDENNVAKDKFEKNAVKAMKSGKTYYEQIISKKGKPYLRAATPVPVVMQKCTICHENYKKAKKGEAIGVLSYTLPIE